MNSLSPETLQEMAEIRREAAEDITDLLFLIDLASKSIKSLGEQYLYLGLDFFDLTKAIRIAKEKAEMSRDYHNTEAYQLENKVKEASDSTSNGLLLKEQERDSNG